MAKLMYFESFFFLLILFLFYGSVTQQPLHIKWGVVATTPDPPEEQLTFVQKRQIFNKESVSPPQSSPTRRRIPQGSIPAQSPSPIPILTGDRERGRNRRGIAGLGHAVVVPKDQPSNGNHGYREDTGIHKGNPVTRQYLELVAKYGEPLTGPVWSSDFYYYFQGADGVFSVPRNDEESLQRIEKDMWQLQRKKFPSPLPEESTGETNEVIYDEPSGSFTRVDQKRKSKLGAVKRFFKKKSPSPPPEESTGETNEVIYDEPWESFSRVDKDDKRTIEDLPGLRKKFPSPLTENPSSETYEGIYATPGKAISKNRPGGTPRRNSLESPGNVRQNSPGRVKRFFSSFRGPKKTTRKISR